MHTSLYSSIIPLGNAARKAEAAALLAAEERELSKSSKPSSAGKKSSESIRGAAKVAAKREQKVESQAEEKKPVQVLAASNIDDALDLMDHVKDSGSGEVGKARQSAAIERHPERRAKAAYVAFEERMLPQLKEENPTLRLSQLKEMLWKLWQKSPENPFNQTTLSYRASKEEADSLVQQLHQETEARLRIK